MVLEKHSSNNKSFLKKYNAFFLFLKYFVFILIIINIVLLSTLVLHEFGHVVVSKFYGCQYKTIFFEENSSPFTEVLCGSGMQHNYSVLGGIILPLLISVMLFFIGGRLSKSVALLMAGFNMILSSKDYFALSYSNSMIFTQIYIGSIFFVIGLFLLARNKFDDSALL